jgi:hypothetical protein
MRATHRIAPRVASPFSATGTVGFNPEPGFLVWEDARHSEEKNT